MPAVDDPVTLGLVIGGTVVLVHLGFPFAANPAVDGRHPTFSGRGSAHRTEPGARDGAPDGEPLAAPITGRSCAAWSYDVEDEWRKDSVIRFRRRRRWRSVIHEHEESEFDLVDDSGAVRVHLEGTEIVGHRTFRWNTVAFDVASAPRANPRRPSQWRTPCSSSSGIS